MIQSEEYTKTLRKLLAAKKYLEKARYSLEFYSNLTRIVETKEDKRWARKQKAEAEQRVAGLQKQIDDLEKALNS